MASVVGKTIFSDGKGKLFFGYYKDNDAVEFVDYKTWKKLSFKDVSKGDTNKQRVIKAIVKNQKQFNKKVDFNMWAKQKKRTFEETMDWFIQNGWINNINKGGIKESVDVLSVTEGQLNIGDTIKVKGGTSLQKMNVIDDKWKVIKKDNWTYTLQKVGSSMKVRHPQTKVDYLIVRPGQSQLPFIVESVNEGKKRYYQQDRVGSSKYTISYHDGKKKHDDGSDFFDIQTFKNKKDLAKFVNALNKSGYVYGFDESVNESVKPSQVRSAISKVKKGLMKKWKQKGGYENFGDKEGRVLRDKFNFNPYGSPEERQIAQMIQGFEDWAMNYDGNMREAKFGYKDSKASYINKHKDEYKVAEKMNKGNEMKFYDDLQAMEDKIGHPKTMLFISNALRGYGVDMYKDPKIKNPADAQEALFLLSK